MAPAVIMITKRAPIIAIEADQKVQSAIGQEEVVLLELSFGGTIHALQPGAQQGPAMGIT